MKPTYRYRPKQPQLPQSKHYLTYYLCNTLFGLPIVLYCLFQQMALPMIREDMLKLILFLILPFGWLLTIPSAYYWVCLGESCPQDAAHKQ